MTLVWQWLLGHSTKDVTLKGTIEMLDSLETLPRLARVAQAGKERLHGET